MVFNNRKFIIYRHIPIIVIGQHKVQKYCIYVGRYTLYNHESKCYCIHFIKSSDLDVIHKPILRSKFVYVTINLRKNNKKMFIYGAKKGM